jgi:DNA repair protein RadD
MIVFLRPTKSTVLYIQVIGRGMRPSPGKVDCLVLDYGSNVARHGPVDAVRPHDKVPGEGGGDAPGGKECPACHEVVHAAVRVCPVCGYKWPHKHAASAALDPVLTSQIRPEWLKVQAVWYKRHRKNGKPDSLRVDYVCGLRTISSWVCLEHIGFAKSKADAWIAERNPGRADIRNVSDALRLQHKLITPTEILVKRNGKFDEVKNYRFERRAGSQDRESDAAA